MIKSNRWSNRIIQMIKLNPQINIFSENIHTQILSGETETGADDKIVLDEKAALDIAKKILKWYLNDEIVFGKSCLFGQQFDCISFDILYSDNDKTHEINKEYRQKDYAADIITFAIFADSEEKFVFDNEINLGEIIISLDKVNQNAQEKGSKFEDELYFLISHGIMHLLGFDHQTNEDYNFIIKTQASALKIVQGEE